MRIEPLLDLAADDPDVRNVLLTLTRVLAGRARGV